MPRRHMIRRIVFALALASAPAAVLLPAPAFAEEVKGLDGRWEGELSTPAGSLPLVLRVSTKNGDTTAILNSPAQTQTDIPVNGVAKQGDNIVFTVGAVQGAFTAKPSTDGKTLTGTWSQGGQSLPLTMKLKPAS
jgi:hypothetical protein